MEKLINIYNFLDRIAPFDTALSFDNVGLLVGNFESEISKVLLALDITDEVCDEAKTMGAELIISHHPIIFRPLKNINFKDTVSILIRNGINAVCAHTNLDAAKQGVNFQLAEKLGLLDLKPLSFVENQPMGFYGYLEKEMDCKNFAEFVKHNLNCNGLRYTETNKKIKYIGVSSGGGGNSIYDAIENGSIDAFVTGEIKHNQILDANRNNIMIVDAGHFKTENVVIEPLRRMLQEEFNNVEFFVSKCCKDKINYL